MSHPPLDPTLDFEAAYAKWTPLFTPLGYFPCMDPTLQAMVFLRELKVWNGKINLAADSSDEEWVLNHLLDAVMPLKMPALAEGKSPALAIDIGTGGGFPGIPLALARPFWSMTLADSVQKKLGALEDIVGKFQPENAGRIRTLAGRAEDLAREPKHRETFDFAFCRAVGVLPCVLELTLPFVKVGGSCFLHRGGDGDRDMASAERALRLLGGQIEDRLTYRIPHRDKPRDILQVRKVSPTPPEYPRRPGVPEKRPL